MDKRTWFLILCGVVFAVGLLMALAGIAGYGLVIGLSLGSVLLYAITGSTNNDNPGNGRD